MSKKVIVIVADHSATAPPYNEQVRAYQYAFNSAIEDVFGFQERPIGSRFAVGVTPLSQEAKDLILKDIKKNGMPK